MKYSAIVLFLGSLPLAACAVEPPEDTGIEADGPVAPEAAGDPEIGVAESALGSGERLYYHEEFKVRGWVVEEVHYEVLPRTSNRKCTPGYQRDHIEVIHRGNGDCSFDKWLSPGDPTDCGASIRVKRSAGGDNIWNGTCEVSIFEKPILTRNNSCVNHCGGSAAECHCDPLCLYYDDCCSDFQLACR
ncbi:hypothetical protein WMF27_20770 [Sorangium sp. So ce281]|uniref:hypothetical protein n=1 Tax=unclassified Sorangium TaxID=2621164 RepID=UPI003F646166